MKYIMKNEEPLKFSDWKALKNADWQPTYADLRGDEKKAVKNSLMAEQGYICCYCERRLIDVDSHIEHLKPQSNPSVNPLDYGNMLCSCQNQLEKGDPRHCGNRKGDDWILITPLTDNCEDFFTFTHDGKIQEPAQGDTVARETIKILGLDMPKLNDARKKAIEPFLDEDLDIDDIARFVSGYLEKDTQGKFSEFWTTINCLFGELAL
ncbi:MAG: TIGR02646 family protein [Deltaproteobacteria bacterium]|nr:TIGR02646 family protein [Candidatus Tharpella aukensis]